MTLPGRAAARSPTCGIVRVDDERGRLRKLCDGRPPALARSARARRSGRAGRGTGCRGRPRAAGCAAATSGNAPSSTSNRPSSASRASIRVEATPETRFAPELLWASRTRGAEDRGDQRGRRRLAVRRRDQRRPRGQPGGEASTRQPGSIVARSLPGSVVPPPRPARRERRPGGPGERELERETHRERQSSFAQQPAGFADLFNTLWCMFAQRLCKWVKTLYSVCLDAAQASLPGDHQHRPRRAGRVPGGDPAALLGRGDPRASCGHARSGWGARRR